jgi:uncharacterized membrane protein
MRKKWIVNTSKFFIPFVLGLGTVGLVGYFFTEGLRAKYWSLVSAYFFPPLGKESVIPIGVGFGIHPLVMALSIAFVDFIVALFLVWNYDLAKKIPVIGKFMEKVESIGKTSSSKYAWIKPLRFIGIVLFVMVPFQGSGGMVGSIVGRLIGMKPWHTVLAITLGAVIGTTIIAYSAESLKSVFTQNFLAGLLIVIILLIIGVMIYVYRKNGKKKNNNKPSP